MTEKRTLYVIIYDGTHAIFDGKSKIPTGVLHEDGREDKKLKLNG